MQQTLGLPCAHTIFFPANRIWLCVQVTCCVSLIFLMRAHLLHLCLPCSLHQRMPCWITSAAPKSFGSQLCVVSEESRWETEGRGGHKLSRLLLLFPLLCSLMSTCCSCQGGWLPEISLLWYLAGSYSIDPGLLAACVFILSLWLA